MTMKRTVRKIFLPSVLLLTITGSILIFARSSLSAQSVPGTPTFNQHIAPIVFEYCADCHHPGGSGPFSLLRFEEVRKRAKQLAVVTHNRYMPPWLPDPRHLRFVGERRLSDEQLRTIQQWVDAGMPEGEAKDLPPVPKFNEGWQLGQPDLIVKMPEAFSVPAEAPNSGKDVFRNFVIPIPVTTTKYVKAIEILPGNKQIVHHANILIDRTGSSRRLDEKDPGPGFGGMEVSIEAESFEPDSHFLFWKPGTVPSVEPEGMAWRCDPGTDLVLNMHLQPTGKPEKIQAEIGLYFTDQPQTIFPMLLQLEHDGALDIPPGKKDFVITDEFTLPVDVDLLGVYPHAHYLGKELQGFATLPDGTKKTLIHITRWDLNWQAIYKYQQPVFLPKGTVIEMRYSYDNSAENERNPNHPPKRVLAGNKSTDEMGHLWLQVLPRAAKINGEDARAILQEALMRQRLKKYPADFTAHFNLGAVLQSAGKFDEAISEFQKALQTRPDHFAALTSLGASLQATGKTAEASARYRQALRFRPDYINARYNLANLLLAAGKSDEAIIHLREILRSKPDDAESHNSLGSALAMKGHLPEAASHYEQSLRINPDNADAHSNYAYVLSLQGKVNEAVNHYEQALRLNPQNADTHNELGVLLGQQGKIAQAVTHFEQALRLNPQHTNARENLKRARQLR